MGKSNRMERRIQAFRDRGAVFSMSIRKKNDLFLMFPDNKDVQRLYEAFRRKNKRG